MAPGFAAILVLFAAIPATPVTRDYRGASAVTATHTPVALAMRAAPEGPPVDDTTGQGASPGDPPPDGDDTPPDDAIPRDGPPSEPTPVGTDPSGEPSPAEPTSTEPTSTEPTSTGTTTDPSELSLEDVFGTAEDHTDVEPLGTGGATGADAPPEPSTSAENAPRRASFFDKLDHRFRVVSSAYFDVHKTEERGWGRNENRLEFYLAYTPNKHIQIVADVEAVFFGVAQAQELDDLASRQMLEPFHLESDAAYVALNDVLPNLDIKIGRQIVVWGTADKFNPTNNINPDDLEDRPLFTEPIANQMVVVDYAPLHDKLWFQGVYVPLFYPALLPPSASAALKDPQTEVPYAREADKRAFGELQELLEIQPGLVPEVIGRVQMPKRRFVDGQAAIKIGSRLGPVDMSVSYYNGRHDIPVPIRADAHRKEDPGPMGTAECCHLQEVTLVYPRMQVIGADFVTQIPFMNNLGFWGEGALFFPQPHYLRVQFPISVDVTPDDDIMNPVTEYYGPTVRGTPFIKATTGFDYTFGKHVYVQLQYLRGFIDEFGADHIGNYLVGGSDLIFFGRHLIFRMFGVVDFPTGRGDEGSYVIFPELLMTPPWGSLTFEVGSFFLLGKDRTKFGQRASGSSIVFFKVTGVF